ncbi:MAG: molybdenum cofactor guanylyltransferase [Bacteroidia bacterium]|nr:molybdenum cofactor guanylyltransferase [Bacteroidia bacterium]
MNDLRHINGLILAGGHSRRMGFDKSGIHYHGHAQVAHLQAMLRNFSDQVYVSVGRHTGPDQGLIVDHYPFETPLNGIASAFLHDSSKAWMAVAVDMPLMSEQAISYLLQHRDNKKLATCFFDSEGRHPDPMCALWETGAHAPMLAYIEKGGMSPREFLMNHDVHLLHTPDPAVLTNINTPAELEQYRKRYS